MRTDGTRAAWTSGAVLALTLIFYVWPLALDVPLVDPDEGLHAAIAQEMLARGDFVMPRFLGEPFLDKPVLYFWALAASIGVLGEHEVAVRLPGLLFGWLGTLTTALLAWQVAGRRLAILAFGLYATTILPLTLNQVAVHDVALIPWTNLALLFLWRAHESSTVVGAEIACPEFNRGARPDRARLGAALREAAVAGLFVGLAMLTKGLVGVALVGLPLAVWLLLRRRLTVRMLAAGLVTLAVGAALAAPWYLAMERAQPGYLHYFFVERHLLGFATTTQIHGDRPWWYYLPLVAGGAWPWVVYLPFAVRRRSGGLSQAWTSLMWIWLVVDLMLLSTAKSKLVTYLLPVFPAIAILAGFAWTSVADRMREESRPQVPRGIMAAVWLHAITGCVLAPVAFVLARAEFGVEVGHAAWIGAAALVGGYVWMLTAWRERLALRALVMQAGLVAATFVLIMAVAFRPAAEQFSARSTARYFNGLGALPPRIWVVDERLGSLVFYLDAPLRRELTPSRIENVPLGLLRGRLPTAPPDVAVVLAERDVSRFARGFDLTGVPYEPAGRHRIYMTGPLRERILKMIGGVRVQPPALTVAHRARALQPGEAVLLVVTSAAPVADVRATAFGREVIVYPGPKPGTWHGLAGIDVETAPGAFDVSVEARDATGTTIATARHAFAVSRRTFPTRQVAIDDAFANPPPSARPRIDREAKQIEEVLARVTRERFWDGALTVPVPGAPTSRFGRRSIVNGEVRGIHGGVDLRAQPGTPVHAPARGRVVLAAEHYFAGNLVILDHGLGVLSFLAHLSRLVAVEGQTVERGDRVGLSGATGRVTGPHLHWGVRVQGARVDPLSLMAVLK